MAKTIESRLDAVEKVVGAPGVGKCFTLEQLVQASQGIDPGPPAWDRRLGEPTLEELILKCRKAD